MGKLIDLVDAAQKNKEHPDSFEIPSNEELNSLKAGDYVKLIFGGKERMWVEITSLDSDNNYKGKLSNVPLFIDFEFGDIITFKREHICSIQNK